MAFERRDGAGGAVDTTITADITNASLSIGITSATGWPSGGANGPFFVIIDYDVAGKEKVEVASRTGTTLTVASVGKRGIDDTVAAAHLAGAKIRFCYTEQDRDEANYTMAQTVGKVTTKGDLIVATAAQVFGRLAVGANNTALIADSTQATGTKWAAIDSATVNVAGTPTTIAPDDAAAAGSGPGLAKVDHRHAIAAATAVSVGSANAEGVSTSFARADHTHDLIAGSVQSGDLAASSVQSANLAAGLINDENMFSAALSPIIVQGTNPGAVGAHRFWFNTTSSKLAFMKRNAADTGWEVIQSMVGMDYTPTLYNFFVDPSTGVNDARYNRKGDLIVVNGYIELGGASGISGRMGVGLPVIAKDLSATYTAGLYGHGATRALDASAVQVWAGVGLVGYNATFAARDRLDFIGTGGGVDWDATHPFPWNGVSGDRFSWFAEYEPASLEDTNYV